MTWFIYKKKYNNQSWRFFHTIFSDSFSINLGSTDDVAHNKLLF